MSIYHVPFYKYFEVKSRVTNELEARNYSKKMIDGMLGLKRHYKDGREVYGSDDSSSISM
jgi:hypothetical protein